MELIDLGDVTEHRDNATEVMERCPRRHRRKPSRLRVVIMSVIGLLLFWTSAGLLAAAVHTLRDHQQAPDVRIPHLVSTQGQIMHVRWLISQEKEKAGGPRKTTTPLVLYRTQCADLVAIFNHHVQEVSDKEVEEAGLPPYIDPTFCTSGQENDQYWPSGTERFSSGG